MRIKKKEQRFATINETTTKERKMLQKKQKRRVVNHINLLIKIVS